MPRPAYRIETPRLVIRCWDPADARPHAAAITESLEHLRPWMPFVHREPETFDENVKKLRGFRAKFDADQDYFYGIFDPEESAVLGGAGLHTRIGEGAREIGYWIHVGHVGRGYATEVAGALTRVAFEVDEVQRVEIHCDRHNAPSAAVPRKLGYTHEATLRRRFPFPEEEPRDTMIWSLFREEYPGSPANAVEVAAFDVLGQRLL